MPLWFTAAYLTFAILFFLYIQLKSLRIKNICVNHYLKTISEVKDFTNSSYGMKKLLMASQTKVMYGLFAVLIVTTLIQTHTWSYTLMWLGIYLVIVAFTFFYTWVVFKLLDEHGKTGQHDPKALKLNYLLSEFIQITGPIQPILTVLFITIELL